jgi:uncharacterized coiled-coil DUF342 family protein
VEKINRNSIIAVIVLSALFTISVGFNIGLGKCLSDNQRFNDRQREYETTIAELTGERDAEREINRELRSLSREARAVISDLIRTVETTGTGLSTANQILRTVINSLQNLDLLYSRSGSNGLDTLVNE